jgi:hypothetical protein
MGWNLYQADEKGRGAFSEGCGVAVRAQLGAVEVPIVVRDAAAEAALERVAASATVVCTTGGPYRARRRARPGVRAPAPVRACLSRVRR